MKPPVSKPNHSESSRRRVQLAQADAANLTGKGAAWYQRYKQLFQEEEEPEPFVADGYEAMNVVLEQRIAQAMLAPNPQTIVVTGWIQARPRMGQRPLFTVIRYRRRHPST
jgi:hypothetical protein